MASTQKKGLITRLLEGKERDEDYARSTLPTNRWQLFFDIFKGNFGKIVKANLLTVLFFIPLFAVIIYCSLVDSSYGLSYPLNGSPIGAMYPVIPEMTGLNESLHMQSDLIRFILIILTSFIASVGLSGGMYVARNMVWTEGIFVANDFWKGVKLNYKNALQTSLFFSILLLFFNYSIDVAELSLVLQNNSSFQSFMLNFGKVLSIVGIVFTMLMSFWMIALGVNYKYKFWGLIKNSAILLIGTLPQSVFFGAICILPFALLFIDMPFIMILAGAVVIFFGIIAALLIWLDFSQWVFDKYVNPKIQGAKVGRGIYPKDASELTEEEKEARRREILLHGKSELMARPMKPIDDDVELYELPSSFTREDLKKLRESRQNMVDDTNAYAEEHKNDEKYQEYNKQFEERDMALPQKEDKKRKPPKLLGQ